MFPHVGHSEPSCRGRLQIFRACGSVHTIPDYRPRQRYWPHLLLRFSPRLRDPCSYADGTRSGESASTTVRTSSSRCGLGAFFFFSWRCFCCFWFVFVCVL